MKKIMLLLFFMMSGLSQVSGFGLGFVYSGGSRDWDLFDGAFVNEFGLSLGFGSNNSVAWDVALRVGIWSERLRISGDTNWNYMRFQPVKWFELYGGFGPYLYFEFPFSNNGDKSAMGVGLRFPLGMRFMIGKKFDIWLAFVPSIGADIRLITQDMQSRVGGGLGAETGVRFWF
jgi:hypothetical protein